MFKPLWGVLAGALALSSLLVRPAQARDLELLEVYEVAASMISRQNPLFLFPGLQADRMTVNELVDERTRMEYYYPPFAGAIKAGVGSVMCSCAPASSTAHACCPVLSRSNHAHNSNSCLTKQ